MAFDQKAFEKWVIETYGGYDFKSALLLSGLTIGDLLGLYNEYLSSIGEPPIEVDEEDVKVQVPTYDEIIANAAISDQAKYALIKKYYPNRLSEWLNGPGLQWVIDNSVFDNGVYILPDGSRWTMNEFGSLSPAPLEEEEAPTWPIPGIPDTATPAIPGLYFDPGTGEYYMVDPNTGEGFVVPAEDAQRAIDEYWGRGEPDTGLPPGATPDRQWVAPGVYRNPDGTYEDEYGESIPPETAQLIINDFESGLTPEDKDALTDPTMKPDIPNTPGYEWLWDGNRWYEEKIEPEEDKLDPQKIPTEPNTPGYEWVWDGSRWVERKIEDVTGIQNLPEGSMSVGPPGLFLDPATGQYYTVFDDTAYPIDEAQAQKIIEDWESGMAPPEITPAQQEQLALQERELGLLEEQLRQQGQDAEADRALQYRQMLAGMLAEPASWLKYHAASGTQAAIQPWMLPLESGQYPQFEAGAPLPGWGPEWEAYYGGQPLPTTPGGVPGGIPPTGVPPTGIPPTGVPRRPDEEGGRQGPAGLSPRDVSEGWVEAPEGGYMQTGGTDVPFDSGKMKMMQRKQKEIQNAIENYLRSQGYEIDMFVKGWAFEEATRRTYQWYAEAYGEEYPIYPGNADYGYEEPPGLPPIPGTSELVENYSDLPEEPAPIEEPPPEVAPPPVVPTEPEVQTPGRVVLPPDYYDQELPPGLQFSGATQRTGETQMARQPSTFGSWGQTFPTQTFSTTPNYTNTYGTPTSTPMTAEDREEEKRKLLSLMASARPDLYASRVPTMTQPTTYASSASLKPFDPNTFGLPTGETRYGTNTPYTNMPSTNTGGTTIPQLPLLPGEYMPGYDPSQLPEFLRPSRQYGARMGPTAQQQYYGYEQARTGAIPEETAWRRWSEAPPAGQNVGLRYRR